jgi:hypothetical protein
MARAHTIQSGCYVYQVGGAIVAREPWAVMADGLSGTRVSAHRDASEFGVWLGLACTLDADGAGSFDFQLRTHGDGPVQREAHYRRDETGLYYSAQSRDMLAYIAPKTTHFFPLMRYFTSAMVSALSAAGGNCDVIVPDISTLGLASSAFAPLPSQRYLVPVAGEDNAFDLSGGAYEAPARIYLTEDGLLAHYAFTDGAGKEWTCELQRGAASSMMDHM